MRVSQHYVLSSNKKIVKFIQNYQHKEIEKLFVMEVQKCRFLAENHHQKLHSFVVDFLGKKLI